MPYLVQRGNVALSAVILGQCAGCASSLRTFCGREAGMPVLHFLTILYEDDHDLSCRLIRNQNIRLPLKGD
jgi:hypothetical protein